jgi:hypothetical protein
VRAHVTLEVAASAKGARTRNARKRIFQDSKVDNVHMVVENVGVLEGFGAVGALVWSDAHVRAHVLGDRLLVVESAFAKVALELLGEVDDAVARQSFDAAHVLAAHLAYERTRRANAAYVTCQQFATVESLIAVWTRELQDAISAPEINA